MYLAAAIYSSRPCEGGCLENLPSSQGYLPLTNPTKILLSAIGNDWILPNKIPENIHLLQC